MFPFNFIKTMMISSYLFQLVIAEGKYDYQNLLIDSVWNSTTSNSKLQIHIPKSLSRTGGYEHRDALFGTPEYGGSIQQKLYYTQNKMCTFNDNVVFGGFPQRHNKKTPMQSPFLLMIDRGDCSFVQKVRNAQKIGAAGVIIADNKCKCFHGDTCKGDDVNDVCEQREPLMSDDGSGADITIPSFLMFKQDADPVKKELQKNSMVRLEMAWSRLNPHKRVEYELWDVVDDSRTKSFAKEFRQVALAMGDKARFTPHLAVFDGRSTGCYVGADDDGEMSLLDDEIKNEVKNDDTMEEAFEAICENMCTNYGRYCASPPDPPEGQIESAITGYDIVRESLRRECIWYLYGHDDGIGIQWWDYVINFNENCNNEEHFAHDACYNDAMKKANVDINEVLECEAKTGGYDGDNDNILLKLQMELIEVSGVIILPAAFVNKEELRGGIEEFETIFSAVCSGFIDTEEPEICNRCVTCIGHELSCVQNKGKCPSLKKAVSSHVFAVTLACTVLFLGLVGMIFYVRQQGLMKSQVRGMVQEYMPIASSKTGEDGLFVYNEDDDDDDGSEDSGPALNMT